MNARNPSDVSRLACALALAAACALTAQSAHGAITDNLVAHWTFDTDYTDSAGTNDGTLQGSAPPLAGGFVGAGALELAGAGTVNVGSSSVFDTTTYTISSWLNTDTVSGWKTAVGSWFAPASFWAHLGNDNGTTFGDHGGGQTSGGYMKTGQWYHVTSVRDGVQNQLWVDGVKLDQTSAGTPVVPGTNNVYIGTKDGANNWWDGKIDDVGIWDRALNPAEIKEVYDKGLAGQNLAAAPPAPAAPQSPATGLVSYYQFDGNGNDTAANFVESSSTVADNLSVVGSVGYAPGQVGQAADLNGGYFTAPLSADVQLPATFTIEAWVNPDTAPSGWQRLLLNWGGGQMAYHFAIRDEYLSLFINEAGGPSFEVAGGGGIGDGQWQHIAGVLDAATNTGKVYINGLEVGSGNFDGTLNTAAIEGLGVGDSVGGPHGPHRYSGLLDELAIWEGVALTGDQIRSHYLAGAAGYGLTAAIPEPVTMLAVGLSVAGLGGYVRRRRKTA